MQINIRTSERNQDVVRRLTTKLPYGTKENVIARIALGYSLQTGKKFQTADFNLYDSKGKEYKDHILFDAKYRDFFIALICQYYGLYKTDDNIPKYIKLHIDHGLELMDSIFQDNYNYTFFDFLVEYIEKGTLALTDLNVSLDAVRNNHQHIEKSFYANPIKIQVGKNLINENESLYLNLNDTKLYNNCHIAVAGNSGTGKTQFALEFLSQIYEQSNGHVNFIYLDFKGLKQDDIKRMDKFFQDTRTNFVDVPQTPFPVNPLTFIDNINEVNKTMGIDKFVDIVCKYSNLGIKQKGKLREATYNTFIEQKGGLYPTLEQINERLQELIGDKKDTLTEIMDELSRYKIFIDDPKNESNFLNSNVYLSLSGDLSNSVRFTSLFLIINYLYNTFMNMDNSPVENNVKALRYVLLIDEAHVLFKEKKYQDILEKLLREIRSKGVSVVLLSQGIDEYNQPNFDFSSMCEIAFLLDIKDKNIKSMEKFLGMSGDGSKKIARSMEKIQAGQAISNIKEYNKGDLFEIKQFKDRK
ncbi:MULTISPECIES: DndE family protein [unclassified Butyricimonas]|uniref:DndE family protein n=1 Tax=unclassified Butyricimonas TaxID=2637652 RepID=UPI000B37928D|nr:MULTISPECIES: DndE family protein [unclassified Butyricimonas]OUN65233.1 DNA sulfur modification protein DndE [Butyricimonas sp. An62]